MAIAKVRPSIVYLAQLIEAAAGGDGKRRKFPANTEHTRSRRRTVSSRFLSILVVRDVRLVD
jgi:hypothetical protein